MKVAIIGCGSLGLLWGARLSTLDLDLVFFTRTEQQQNILNDQGIFFYNHQGELHPYSVVAEVSDFEHRGTFDIVLVMVKQVHLEELMQVIQSITHSESQILFFQNGLGHEEQIGRLQERPWTYAVVTTEGALRDGVCGVRHTGLGTTWLGLFPQREDAIHWKMERFMEYLQTLPDMNIREDRKILSKMWEKLLINCVINPLTAMEGVRNGELQAPRFDERVRQLVDEEVQVAHEMGFTFCEREIRDKVYDVCAKTKHNFSSMAQDVRRGVHTEIDYLNGIIVHYGKCEGIATPCHQEVVDGIKGMLPR